MLRRLGTMLTVLTLSACDGSGGVLAIDDAEAETQAAVTAVADGLGLEDRVEQPLRTPSRCELPTGESGASNTVGVRGVPTTSGDPLDRGAQLLAEAGVELVDSGLDDTVFGRRGGMRVTVVLEPGGTVAVDGATGCKPFG